MRFLTLLFLFCFASCSHVRLFPCYCGCNGSRNLSVLSENIDQNRLSSTHVNAPDPLQELNPHGQRLYVNWRIPKKYRGTHLHGVLKVRFKEPKQETLSFEIDQLTGTYVYTILNEEYFARRGILSYQVKIFSDDTEIDCLTHKMWAELISFED